MFWNKKILLGITMASLLLALPVLILVAESSRTLPANAFLNDIALSGMNRQQATQRVDGLIEKLEKKTYSIASAGESTLVLTASELGIHYDASKTLADIFDRKSWLMAFADFSEHLGTMPEVSTPSLQLDAQQFDNVITAVLDAKEHDYQDARMVWKDNGWMLIPSAPGVILKDGERERIEQSILQSTSSAQSFPAINAQYETVDPLIKTADLEPLFADLKQLVAKPFLLTYGLEQSAIDLREHSDWLAIDPLAKSIVLNEEFALNWIHGYAAARNEEPGKVTISSIEEVASEYDGKTVKEAHFTGDFKKGKVIDEQKILADLKSLIQTRDHEKKIAVTWETLQPQIVSLIPNYQFPQLLSTGISSFRYGNHANRVTNIKLSLATLKGVVIDPQEEFSFNRVTGYITPQKGYTKTQVIMLGKVEDGIGGGVCQTSTTMYRSILNAGFPVTERRNHTLDIIYYHEFGYGLDATVYADSGNDLKFINDFPGPILINTYTDDAKTEAVVEFYGLSDQRRVELTDLFTGDSLFKKWDWKITWPDREELRSVESRYALPKEEEAKPVNPLEG